MAGAGRSGLSCSRTMSSSAADNRVELVSPAIFHRAAARLVPEVHAAAHDSDISISEREVIHAMPEIMSPTKF